MLIHPAKNIIGYITDIPVVMHTI